ncbi:hypothetical protein [Aureispira anguillae]|uniref:Uncharacterized protein n=1 Tax=Aureispira anguillae TaxID=2864201 RepID=A0A915YBM2_9BACT|nr:hypothetical protein [Aureispira anguillae]BDS10096.1 hypothetical protein AsAng_0008030 [Aureispira anguillae]
MDNRVKIILVAAALLFLVWVFFTLNRKKDDPNDPKNEQEKEDLQKQTCTKITGSLYLGKKTVARDSIANQVRAGEYSKDVFELYREYRAEAIGAGIPDHFEAIRDYAYWAEADEQVQKDGFCFMNV